MSPERRAARSPHRDVEAVWERYPDSPSALRDLSVSLNNIANIQREHGQLNDALSAYTESLNLARRILTDYGDTPQSLRDLSISEGNITRIQELRGQVVKGGWMSTWITAPTPRSCPSPVIAGPPSRRLPCATPSTRPR